MLVTVSWRGHCAMPLVLIIYLLEFVQIPRIVVAWIVAREISAMSLYSARGKEGGGRERRGGVGCA